MKRPTIRPGLDLAALAEAQAQALPAAVNPYRPGTPAHAAWSRRVAHKQQHGRQQ